MAERIREMLMHTYQIRSCEGKLKPSPEVRPCFDYHVKKCLGPCAELQSAEEYQARIAEARDNLANLESGAVGLLKQRMDEAVNGMAFEEAAMIRDGIREIQRMMIHSGDTPLAVSDINVVVALPTNDHYKTIELYALRRGRLVMQRVMGMKAPLKSIANELSEAYANGQSSDDFTDIELDELRIITSWLHQKRDRTHAFEVDVDHLDDLNRIEAQVKETIRIFAEREHERHTNVEGA